MQKPDPKKKAEDRSPEQNASEAKGITSPETFLASRIARELSESYRDPFAAGPRAVAEMVYALSNFALAGELDQDLLGQFFTDHIAFRISESSEGAIKVDRRKGITTIVLPNIPRQSPKRRSERIEKLMLHMTHSLPIAQYNFFVEMLRGMPEENRNNLLAEYSMSKKILVVDDEPEIRQMFAHYLSKHDLREADGFTSALEIVEQGFKPDYVITDYHFDRKKSAGIAEIDNQKTGIDLAKAIREKLSSPIFVYSGDPDVCESATKITNTMFVEKDFEGLTKIAAAISGKA